jgi:hypothetical protein
VQNNSHTKSINIQVVNLVLFVVGDDLWGHVAWRSTFGENDGGFVVEGRQAVVDYFEAALSIVLIERVLFFEENVLRLDVPVHNPPILEVLNPRKDLPDDRPDLVSLQVVLLLPVGDFLVQSDPVQQLNNEVVLVPILVHLEQLQQILVLETPNDLQLVEDRFLR